MKHKFFHKYFYSSLLFFLLFPQLSLKSQHAISGTIEGYNKKSVVLEAYHGEMLSPVDTVLTDETGAFTIGSPLHIGMYRLSLSTGVSTQLLFEGRPVQFVWNNYSKSGKIQFVDSRSNQIWNDYMALRDETFFLQDLLKPVIRDYNRDTRFYQLALHEFDSLQNNYQSKVDSWIAQSPESIAAQYIKTDMRPALDLNVSFKSQREELKQHFFDHTDFGDTLLIKSNILTRKMIDFLSLFQTEQESMQAIQFEFIKGLNILFEKAAVEPKMYVFVLDYLIEGFAQLGLPAVTDYISSLPHFDQVCMETETYIEIEQIVGPYRSTVLGAPAPDLIKEDIDGNPFGWSRIDKPNTLLVFWSITCPHCLELMPKLKAFAERHPDFEMVSVVLSPDNKTLRDFLKQEGISNWIHLSDGLGWESPMAKDYNIFGTPTLFVLDADKQIVSKPSGMKELQEFITAKNQ